MNPRKLIHIGVFVIVASVLSPTLFGLWMFYNAFRSLQSNQTAGIGAVGGAMFESVIFGGATLIIGVLTGTILILVGNYKKGKISAGEN